MTDPSQDKTPDHVTYDYDQPPKSKITTPVAAVVAFLVAALLFVDPFGWHGLDEALRGESGQTMESHEEEQNLYTCPMHPEILQDGPGACPICGMDLVPVDRGEAAPSSNAAATADESVYTCPMHPEILESEPGSCPICGMDLVLQDDELAGHEHVGTDHRPMDASMDSLYTCPMHPDILQDEPGSCPICGMDLVPADHEQRQVAEGPAVSIDPRVVQNMNVRIEPVRRRDIQRDLHAVGYLEVDPKRRVTVTTKTSGWVEKVYVHYVGEPVRKGQPLFEVYAPELVQTQQELLSAQRYAGSLRDAPDDARRRAEELVAATRTRLDYWDVPEEAVDQLLESGDVVRTVTVRAPASGLVTKRLDGLEGMAVKPGLDIFEIADLSSLWLTVELYENQVAWIRVGSRAQIKLSYFPGEEFTGTVRFIEPELRAETRTLGVRIEVPNPRTDEGRRLRAGMYAEVQLHPPAVEGALTVPSQAVLRTGERNLVVAALGDGRFQPREVLLGHEGDGFVQVVSGVEEGDRVVTSAQFLIDSESNLRAAIEQLRSGHQGAERQ